MKIMLFFYFLFFGFINTNVFGFTDQFDLILKVGSRNLEWLVHINRSQSKKIDFIEAQNIPPRPKTPESPEIYNRKTIIEEFEHLLRIMPEPMKDVLIDDKPFTNDIPIDLECYLYYGYLIDVVYSYALRWKLFEPHLDELKERRKKDVRSYYALMKIRNLNSKLKFLSFLSKHEQEKLKNLLVGICYNTNPNLTECTKNLNRILTADNGDATCFFNAYIQNAQNIYNSYFTIPDYARRNDIEWSYRNPHVATIPFLDVDDQLKEFLHNIELEWQRQDWQLKLNYVSSGDVPQFKFGFGVSTHVNKIGGNEIIFDGSRNQTLYTRNNQAIIAHEFGHVLGFPDCYIEFYDDSLNAIVSYQLDKTNLMCATGGSFQEIHFNELVKNYYRY